MMDYTFNGVPIAKMATEDIHDCLANGIAFNFCTIPKEQAEKQARERLELELFIRSLGLRT